MEFTYLKKQFIGDNVKIYSNGGVHLEVGKRKIVFKNWDEVREFMYKYSDIYKEAALTKKRQRYGKDLVINYDEEEGVWLVFWRGQSIEVSNTLLRELVAILRFFIKKYHKLMLDYNSYKLKEGFVVETGSTFHSFPATNTGL